MLVFFPLFSRNTSKLALALRVPVVGSPDGSLCEELEMLPRAGVEDCCNQDAVPACSECCEEAARQSQFLVL